LLIPCRERVINLTADRGLWLLVMTDILCRTWQVFYVNRLCCSGRPEIQLAFLTTTAEIWCYLIKRAIHL